MDQIEENEVNTDWKKASRPNYFTNVNLKYPYSELPYLGQYHLVKIPTHDQLVEHVDYWGEGRIMTSAAVSGFRDCYNVNRQYQVVSNGPDEDCKIPNRIPVFDEDTCDTSAYIKDNSVKLVTLMSAPIIEACARDIARIVNPEVGSVVIFGFKIDSPGNQRLNRELSEISLYYCPGYKLPDYFDDLMPFDSYIAYLNVEEIEEQLYNALTAWNIDTAVEITQSLNKSGGSSVIASVVEKLLDQGIQSTMTFAYKLWDSGEEDIVKDHFPNAFKLIFNGDEIEIVSNYYENAMLKLDSNTDEWNNRLAWGDNSGATGERFSWSMVPIWKDNKVFFQLKNNQYDMFLRLDIHTDSAGDRKGWGSKNLDDVRYDWKLEAMNHGHTVLFYIVNCEYDQPLKLDAHVDNYGDRQLWGNNGYYFENIEYFGWLVRSN